MTPTSLVGTTIPNPGDGYYRLRSTNGDGFETVNIVVPDPAVALAGTMTFYSGKFTAVLNLAEERFLKLAGCMPRLDVRIEGAPSDPTAFNITLT